MGLGYFRGVGGEEFSLSSCAINFDAQDTIASVDILGCAWGMGHAETQ